VSRATAAEKAERLNHARVVLVRLEHLPDAVERMVQDCDVSPRQAYRYLRHARRLKAPVPVSEAKIAFTVKLSRTLVHRLREYAASSGLTLSEIVRRGISALLNRGRGRG
jgi:predicted DNA-binding transcriptional regulator YafY